MTNKFFGLLGLAVRARKVRSGEFSTEKSIKEMKSRLVVVAEDASENTKKMFRNMTEYRNVPYYEYGSKEALGRAMGLEYRASLSVEDVGFAEQMKKILDGGIVNEVR